MSDNRSQMPPDRASSTTAVRVAALRAAHQIIDGEPKILDDPIVARLLDDFTIGRIRQNSATLQTPEIMFLRSHVVTRSRFAEDRLAEAVNRGVKQFVILGAGLDTFAWRQPEWASGLTIFEIDHLASQREKRQLLDKAGIVSPTNLEFVAVDFEKESIRDGLMRSRFDFNAPAFFSWLGVMAYLTEQTVDAVLRFVGSLQPSTEIVFSFNPPRPGGTIAMAAAAVGEPFLSHLDQESLEPKLKAAGFSTVFFPTAESLAVRYFQGRTDLPSPKQNRLGSGIV